MAEVYRELKLEELWMENRKVKEGKKNPQDKYYKASKLIRGRIINKDTKQEKCHGKTTGQQQATG